ncbi:glycosyltransferase [Aureliella helgolandensis]|uniref:Chondroitin synthase n=1 Tax=Aureliella helgolandensis TaxID=2527968 RepID=A0A518FZI9_9BACT|nr:glycosyltransferase [Aureliella helgolandensis]QDV21777.1 Chondroitin synthase [Aureliella helgolandensis]
MRVSVIVTTFNRPSYLQKVLASYLHQTRAPDELIVADDGSTDATESVIAGFTERAPFPILHAWQEHQGGPRLSHLRNLATRQTTGDYLIYTDGDCVASPHFVADHVRLARPDWFVQGKRAWVRYQAMDNFTGQESFLRKLWLCATNGLTKPHWLLHVAGIAMENKSSEGIRSCNLGVFRENVVQINGWNEQFLGFWRQDSEFALRLMRSGVRRHDALFSAMVYHLEHEKNLNIQDLERNNRLLAEAQYRPIFTPLGLFAEAPQEQASGRLATPSLSP